MDGARTGPRTAPHVGIVVVTYESRDVLPRLVETLAATRYPDVRCAFVDNASTDGTADWLRAHAPGQVVGNATNVGFGRACNQGAALLGDVDYVVFLNPDLDLTRDWLAQLVADCEREPDIGAIAPATRFMDEPAHEPDTTAPLEDQATVSGAALMVRSDVFRSLGGFDERIFLYWEDTDLCWRIWLAGLRVVHDRRAVIAHERGGSGGGSAWAAEQIKNGLYVHLKIMPWRRVAPFAALMVVKTLLALVRSRDLRSLHGWTWNARQARSTLALRREFAAQRRERGRELAVMAARHHRAFLRRRLRRLRTQGAATAPSG